MKAQIKIFVVGLCVPLSLLLISGSVVYATIIGSAVDNLDGTFTYSYDVDNTLGAFDISVWSLEFFITPDWDQLDTFSGGM